MIQDCAETPAWSAAQNARNTTIHCRSPAEPRWPRHTQRSGRAHRDCRELFLALAAYDRGQAWRTLLYTGVELAGIGPWLAASVLLAAAAKATGADTLIARAFTGRQGRMIVAAALMGALLPFCSCGVVPLVAGLLAAGVPLAPVMAYWIASPLMNPTQFLVTAGGLGIGFALAKAAGAIGMGVASGYATMALTRGGWLSQGSALRIAPVASSCCAGKRVTPAPDRPVWQFWTEPERAQIFLVEASATGWLSRNSDIPRQPTRESRMQPISS
jgi:uncharacterized membrane protein YraQ (UPF0718 family)